VQRRRTPFSIKAWLLALPLLLGAEPAPPAGPAPITCTEAAGVAERAFGLPHGLLAAIGRAESGRMDPRTGALTPWPWTIDVEGRGAFFDSPEGAIAAVSAAWAAGQRSIDVGCFQVNLLHHPAAFASLAEAFDPAGNARAAAQFLAALYRQSGDWPTAVGLYHSATPGLGAPYRLRVLAGWRGDAAGGTNDPVVIRIAPGAAGVRVFTPHMADAVGDARLPRVFTPQ
jgi:hypothetical protein